MSIHKRTHQELVQELRNQLAALRKSCAGYDEGDEWEAPRLATVVYTLVNDGPRKGVSVLTQLGIRDRIPFASYAVPNPPGNLAPWAPLCMVHFHGAAEYIPKLNERPADLRRVNFKRWWAEPVFENAAGKLLTRMNLVFHLRSKDGGGHFDAELPPSSYLEMRTNALGFGFGIEGQKLQPMRPTAHLASMRHIAFEVEQSLLPFL